MVKTVVQRNAPPNSSCMWMVLAAVVATTKDPRKMARHVFRMLAKAEGKFLGLVGDAPPVRTARCRHLMGQDAKPAFVEAENKCCAMVAVSNAPTTPIQHETVAVVIGPGVGNSRN